MSGPTRTNLQTATSNNEHRARLGGRPEVGCHAATRAVVVMQKALQLGIVQLSGTIEHLVREQMEFWGMSAS